MEATGLRIFLMGTGGYASIILDKLLERGEEVVGVCCNQKPSRQGLKTRIVRSSRKIGSRMLDNMGIYIPRGFTFQSPFNGIDMPADIALPHGIPVFSPRLLRAELFENQLRKLGCDVMLVAGFRRLIPPNIISLARYAMNLHTSLLPKHRGGTPTRWVIRNGESETGVTIHELSEKYDTGRIVLQESLKVYSHDTYGELEMRLAHLASKMALKVLDMAATGTLSSYPQNEEAATYEPSYKDSWQWIDWMTSAEDVRRTCYAIRPLSGGFTSLSQSTLCVWDGEDVDGNTDDVRPGSIIEIASGLPVVACGSGAFLISEFLVGGRILTADTIVKRVGMKVGSLFDASRV